MAAVACAQNLLRLPVPKLRACLELLAGFARGRGQFVVAQVEGEKTGLGEMSSGRGKLVH